MEDLCRIEISRINAEIEIGKDLAKRLRKLASLSEEELAKRIEEKRKVGRLTKTSVLSDSQTPKKELKCYQPLLSFLKDLEKHPENYDADLLVDDPELVVVYKQIRDRLLALIEELKPHN
jgi:hypothetical protein